jgi:hypothetical protein
MEGDYESARKNVENFVAPGVRTSERFLCNELSVPSREWAPVCDDGMFSSQLRLGYNHSYNYVLIIVDM